MTRALFGSARVLFGSAKALFRSPRLRFHSARPLFGLAKARLGAARDHFGSARGPFATARDLSDSMRVLFGAPRVLFDRARLLFGTVRALFDPARALFGSTRLLLGLKKDLSGTSRNLSGSARGLLATARDLSDSARAHFDLVRVLLGSARVLLVSPTTLFDTSPGLHMTNQAPSHAPWLVAMYGAFGSETGGTKRATSLCFVGLGLEPSGKLWHVGSFRRRDVEGPAPSRLAYTALAFALTMILKTCRLMEVEEPERNSAMQTADRLGSRRGKNSLAKNQGLARARILRLGGKVDMTSSYLHPGALVRVHAVKPSTQGLES